MKFVDTNVLVYSLALGQAESGKADIALKIMSGPDIVLSVQVLQEFQRLWR